ncbi:diguanylate cyclase [Acidovorax sp. CCYZU-2555]|uniref:sensor domain-containing diguanylate cyclase n=1 Tax=Acidovorax sp. CCYZU-2555 TaxID=2835042 RepID=UPI001BCFBF0E|nr:diguanylate cyclase [Acidovorax sp. CCYZU-2555]MBS7778052.1 diguanylate cyclase [Acidovorax sp. CCYZU-2555]
MALDADLSRAAGLSDEGRLLPRARLGALLRCLLLLMVVSVLLASAGSAWYVHRGVVQESQAHAGDQQTDEVELVARLLAARVEQQQKVLLTLADSMPLKRLQDTQALARALHEELPLVDWFDSVSVALADGRLMAYMRAGKDRPLESLDANERELLRRTLAGGKPMVGTVLQAESDDLRLLFTAPLRTGDGEVIGVMAGGMRLSSQALLPPAAADSWNASRLMLVAPDGAIVAHSNPARWLGHVRDEIGLGVPFVRTLQQQLPVQIRSSSLAQGDYLYTLAGMPLPQWFLVRVTRLDAPPLWGLAGWGSAALLGAALLALLAAAIMVLLAQPWMELTARAAQMLQRHAPGGAPRLARMPALSHAWGEVAVLWRALHALSRQRDTQARRAARFQAQTVTILEEAPVAIVVTRHDRVELLGTQAARMLGYEPLELQGYPIRQLCASDAEHRRLMERIDWEIRAYGQFDGEVCLMRKNGSPVWLRMQGRRVTPALRREAGAGAAVVWMVRDVTDQREARTQPQWQAQHDALTQLPNREALTLWLQHWLDERRRPTQVAGEAWPAPGQSLGGVLLFLDLDHFASVNDLAGHDAGDALLCHFARLLETLVRHPGAVARLGGDEFAVLLPDASAREGRAQADQLCQAISAWEASYQGQRFWLGVSIGMVVLDAQRPGIAAMLHAADMACYEAKRQGRGRVHQHSDALAEKVAPG